MFGIKLFSSEKTLCSPFKRYLAHRTISEILLLAFLILLLLSYFYYRPLFFLAFLCWSALGYFLYPKISPFTFKFLAFLLFLYIAVFSYMFFRGADWDVMYYFRNTLILKETDLRPLNYLETPYFPYFGELLFTSVWKLLGFRTMNSLFGIAVLFAIFAVYVVYKELGLSRKVSLISICILFCSPFFVPHIFLQFKFDMLLLFFVSVSMIFWVKLLRKKYAWINFIFLGVFLGLGVITKIVFLPFSLVMLGLLFVSILCSSGETRIRGHSIFRLFISFLFMLLIFFGWVYYASGIKIPFLGTFSLQDSKISLYRNPTILRECMDEKHRMDFENDYMPSAPLILQPYYLISNINGQLLGVYGMFDPGFLLYFSILLFPFFWKVFLRKEVSSSVYVFLFVIISLAIYFSYVKGVFWYIIFVFPFLAPVFPSILFQKFKLSNRLVVSILGGFLAVPLIVGMYIPYTYFISPKNIGLAELESTYLGVLRETADLLSQETNEGYILVAAQHKYLVNLMFFKEYADRALESNYYFASSEKNIDEIYAELISNNIHYILVHKDKLLDPWYQNCARENNEILLDFLNKYTTQSEKIPYLFTII